ncbi:hypothetical protein [Streptomyces sp. DT203]|uniref:hypothetical protein n=1 Tax=Streptomyces sp. DT203 TaxID=3393424 RepID=UPI003CF7ADF7
MSQLTFTWTLRHQGWAYCKVADDQGEATVIASDITLGPERFLDAITKMAVTDTETRAEFEGEPQVSRWFFKRDDSDVAIRLMLASDRDAPDTSGTVIWSSRQPITVLCQAVIDAFDQAVQELGEAGYREQWGRPFPRNELEELRTAWRNDAARENTA